MIEFTRPSRKVQMPVLITRALPAQYDSGAIHVTNSVRGAPGRSRIYKAVPARYTFAPSPGFWFRLNAASRIFLAIGAAASEPKPPCSTTTDMTTRGSS